MTNLTSVTSERGGGQLGGTLMEAVRPCTHRHVHRGGGVRGAVSHHQQRRRVERPAAGGPSRAAERTYPEKAPTVTTERPAGDAAGFEPETCNTPARHVASLHVDRTETQTTSRW